MKKQKVQFISQEMPQEVVHNQPKGPFLPTISIWKLLKKIPLDEQERAQVEKIVLKCLQDIIFDPRFAHDVARLLEDPTVIDSYKETVEQLDRKLPFEEWVLFSSVARACYVDFGRSKHLRDAFGINAKIILSLAIKTSLHRQLQGLYETLCASSPKLLPSLVDYLQ